MWLRHKADPKVTRSQSSCAAVQWTMARDATRRSASPGSAEASTGMSSAKPCQPMTCRERDRCSGTRRGESRRISIALVEQQIELARLDQSGWHALEWIDATVDSQVRLRIENTCHPPRDDRALRKRSLLRALDLTIPGSTRSWHIGSSISGNRTTNPPPCMLT